MAKFYIASEKHNLVTDANDKFDAADKAASYWHSRGLTVSNPLIVNERGFPNPLGFEISTDDIVSLNAA